MIKKQHEGLKMAEEEKDHLSFPSLKDFEERGIKIEPNWSSLQIMATVYCLAFQETRGRKGMLLRLVMGIGGSWLPPACNGFEYGVLQEVVS